MKKPRKGELEERIAELERENERLRGHNELVADVDRVRPEQRPSPIHISHQFS